MLTGVLYVTPQTGFFPSRTRVFCRDQWSRRRARRSRCTNRKAIEAMKIIAADPDVDEAHYNAGGSAQAQINIGLRSLEEGRTASATDINNRLRPGLAEIAGAQVIVQAMQDITIGGRPARARYQYTLSDGDLDELNEWAPQLVSALQKLPPELKDVSSDQQSQAPAANLIIDRDAAGRFGISPADIDAAIYNQGGGTAPGGAVLYAAQRLSRDHGSTAGSADRA